MHENFLHIAAVQANLAWENAPANISIITKLIKSIGKFPHIVVLPEMFTTGFSVKANSLAQSMDGASVGWMKSFAKQEGFAICGSLIIEEDNRYFNRFVFATPQGKVYTYNKRHLFTYAKEHSVFTRGEERVVFEYLGWRILPQICYDLRFPVWFRSRNDYDLLINVANFPSVRRDAWNTLLQARAIENQCYVVAANRVGTDGAGLHYTGDSQIVDFNGNVLSTIALGCEGVIEFTLSRSELFDYREKFPVLTDADSFTL